MHNTKVLRHMCSASMVLCNTVFLGELPTVNELTNKRIMPLLGLEE